MIELAIALLIAVFLVVAIDGGSYIIKKRKRKKKHDKGNSYIKWL